VNALHKACTLAKDVWAFRRFKDTIHRYGIQNDWFGFRDDAYREIAISWLEDKGFAYTDDLNAKPDAD
jgi:hypothetical protein